MVGMQRRLTCTLFVDFDNTYSALRAVDEDSGTAFVQHPTSWLEQLRQGVDEDGAFARRFLQKSVYLNPAPYGQFRATFTRAGFRVVDCPSLTKSGKSSADMWMAVDILDAIAHPTSFDEFVIISSDADFTPLVHRIRAYNRRATLITTGFAAAAYRANADQVIDGPRFAQILGVSSAADEPSPVLSPAATLSPDVVGRPADEGARRDDEPSAADSDAAPSTDQEGLRRRAAQAIADLVATAAGPVPASAAAAAAMKVDPGLPGRRWDGLGFMGWVRANLDGVGTKSTPGPGFVWDASRFDEPRDDEPLSPLQQQVASVTEIPRLTEEQYRSLHSALSEASAQSGLSVSRTPVIVRELLQATYPPVSLRSITQVVRGLLLYTDGSLTAPVSREQVAAAWAELVIALAEGSQVSLNEADRLALKRWLGGGLAG